MRRRRLGDVWWCVSVVLVGCGDPRVDSSAPESSAQALTDAADCPPGYHVITGTEGPDELVGTPGSDCLVGGGGDDRLFGGGGDDVLLGGPGDDLLSGGWGDDVLEGGGGNDRLLSVFGRDTASGGACHDLIVTGWFGRGEANGGDGVDRIMGSTRRRMIDGGPGTDACRGVACEASPFDGCGDDVDCGAGERCVAPVGLCAPLDEAPREDASCDGVDSDCDGEIDEDCTVVARCGDDTGLCDPNATCTDTPTGPSCACDGGFAGDGQVCVDVDECAQGLDTCDANASCVNTVGGFSCACDGGFAGDGQVCVDVDECAQGLDTCDPLATCLNTDGGFTCQCPGGAEVDGSCRVPTSCLAVLSGTPAAADGIYPIDPDGAGPAPRADVYCDMTTDGGGYQLVSVSVPGQSAPLLGTAACQGLDTSTPCAGRLDPAAVNGAAPGTVLVRDLDAPAWIAFEGFSAGAMSALRYLTGQRTVDGSGDCGATTDNVCDDSSVDPNLTVARTSGFAIDYTPPLRQSWTEGGWRTFGGPASFGTPPGVFHRVHGSGPIAGHDLRGRTRRNVPTAAVGTGAQALLYRPDLCGDGVRNGLEADVDCGGLCGGCAVGLTCTGPGDCASGVCGAGVCGDYEDSCAAIAARSPAAPSGRYMVDPDGPAPEPAQPTYCDMATDGGGWQLISVARADMRDVLIGASLCADPRPSSACRGRMPSRSVRPGVEVLVEAVGTPHFAVYDGFSMSGQGTLFYLSGQRSVLDSDSCNAGGNFCGESSRDPMLSVRGSGYPLDVTAPLFQWWHRGGWRVGFGPMVNNVTGILTASGYDGFSQIRQAPSATAPTEIIAEGVQRIWFR